MLPDQGNRRVQLFLGNGVGTGKQNGRGRFKLVIVELAEVLHIHLHLTGIRHGDGVAQHDLIPRDLIHRRDHIRELPHTGGLNEDAVRVVLRDHLFQRLAEVAHQGAADAAGIHLRNGDARLLQKAAVNADLAEFILNEHQLLPGVALRDHFFDQRGLSGSQKAGVNIDFRHDNTLCKNFLSFSIPRFPQNDKSKFEVPLKYVFRAAGRPFDRFPLILRAFFAILFSGGQLPCCDKPPNRRPGSPAGRRFIIRTAGEKSRGSAAA